MARNRRFHRGGSSDFRSPILKWRRRNLTSPDALTAKRLDVGVRPVTVSEARLRFDAPALGAVFAGAFLPPLLRPASVLASSGSILIAARPAGVMISA